MRRPAGGRSRNRLEGKLAGTGTRACHSLGRLAGTRRIRLGPHNRTALETAACEQGTGLFTLVGRPPRQRRSVFGERRSWWRAIGWWATQPNMPRREMGSTRSGRRRVISGGSASRRHHRVVGGPGGSLPQEPSKLRPAVIVEDHEVVPEEYLNMVVVPSSRDAGPAPQVAGKADRADSGQWRSQHVVGSGPSRYPRVLAPH